MLTLYAGTSAEQIKDLSLLTIDEMKRAAENLSQAEVDRARAQMKAGLLMGLESASNRAERMASMLQIWGRVPSLKETVEYIDAVTLQDVKRLAQEMISSSPMTCALYGPVDGAASFQELEAKRVA